MNMHNGSIEQQLPEGTFRGLFWQEQLKAAKVKDARQTRWHPMIKRCINLKLLSSSMYHSLSEHQDSTSCLQNEHYATTHPLFQEVDKMLDEEASLHGSTEWNYFVVILFDEMKMR